MLTIYKNLYATLVILGKIKITEQEIIDNTKDLNDYKNVVSLGYILLTNYRYERFDINKLFLDGLNRIVKKDLASAPIRADDIAILGMVLFVRCLRLSQYSDWVQKLLECRKSYLTIHKQNADYIDMLINLSNGENIQPLTNIKDEKQIIFHVWLMNLFGNQNDALKEQCQIIQNLWKKDFPYFDEYWLNLLTINLVDFIIESKFKNELLNIEKLYNNAVNKAKNLAKCLAVFMTMIVIAIIIIPFSFFLFQLFLYYKPALNRDFIVPFARDGFGLLIGVGGIIKHRLIYKWWYKRIETQILKYRGLK